MPVFEHGVDRDAPYDHDGDADDAGDLRWTVFSNPAYACDGSGAFWFEVIERVQDAPEPAGDPLTKATRGRVRPLWVRFNGSNVGVFDEERNPLPDWQFHDHEPPPWAEPSATLADLDERAERIRVESDPATVQGKALDRGYRVLIPGSCDTDAFGGLGTPYPNHPDPTQTVDGALAAMAAITYVVTSPDGSPGSEPSDAPLRPTSRIFLWGGSAGAAGAYSVLYSLRHSDSVEPMLSDGVKVNAVVLDSGAVTERLIEVWTDNGGLRRPPTILDLDFLEAIGLKVRNATGDAQHFLPTAIDRGVDVPTLAHYDVRDFACGGHAPPLTDPSSPGAFTGENCDYAYSPIAEAIERTPNAEHAVARWDETGHGFHEHIVSNQPDHPSVQTTTGWLDAVLASNPPTPWPYRPAHTFIDLPSDPTQQRDLYDAASWADDQDIISGFSGSGCPAGAGSCYKPATLVSRQAMAAFLHRFSGAPPFAPPPTPRFTDVPTSHPFRAEIEWMAEEGFSTGSSGAACGSVGSPCFKPGDPVSRQAAAAFLYRRAGQPAGPWTTAFSDVPDNHPFRNAIGWMASTKLSTGYSGTACSAPEAGPCFQPTAPVTRLAIGIFLHRLASAPAAWATPAPDLEALLF